MPVADGTLQRTEQIEEISSRSADYICDPGSPSIRGSGFTRSWGFVNCVSETGTNVWEFELSKLVCFGGGGGLSWLSLWLLQYIGCRFAETSCKVRLTSDLRTFVSPT
jgi:hypothetical protein